MRMACYAATITNDDVTFETNIGPKVVTINYRSRDRSRSLGNINLTIHTVIIRTGFDEMRT